MKFSGNAITNRDAHACLGRTMEEDKQEYEKPKPLRTNPNRNHAVLFLESKETRIRGDHL